MSNSRPLLRLWPAAAAFPSSCYSRRVGPRGLAFGVRSGGDGRKRWIGDGQLQELEQHYIQAIYRYGETVEQGPSLASKVRREMVLLEVEVRRLRYGY